MAGVGGNGLIEIFLDFGMISFVLSLISQNRRSPLPSVSNNQPNPPTIVNQQTITDLQNQCQLLQAELRQQQKHLKTDCRDSTFEQLQPLLTNLPTVRKLIEIKPDLPARHLIPLFTPLENWLQDWDIEAIGIPWEQVPYDPQLHQPAADNYIPGEPVYVRIVGYRTPTQILHPAQVSRTPPPSLNP